MDDRYLALDPDIMRLDRLAADQARLEGMAQLELRAWLGSLEAEDRARHTAMLEGEDR